jgi:hypothetical protein
LLLQQQHSLEPQLQNHHHSLDLTHTVPDWHVTPGQGASTQGLPEVPQPGKPSTTLLLLPPHCLLYGMTVPAAGQMPGSMSAEQACTMTQHEKQLADIRCVSCRQSSRPVQDAKSYSIAMYVFSRLLAYRLYHMQTLCTGAALVQVGHPCSAPDCCTDTPPVASERTKQQQGVAMGLVAQQWSRGTGSSSSSTAIASSAPNSMMALCCSACNLIVQHMNGAQEAPKHADPNIKQHTFQHHECHRTCLLLCFNLHMCQ